MVKCGKMWDKFVSLQKIYWGEMLNLIGTFDCKVDSKGRVLIPSSLKKQLTDHSKDGFIIKRSVFNRCLDLYPYSEWNNMVSQVDKLNRFVKKNNDFIRSYMSGIREINMDSAGRILIPKDLVVYATIEKEIVIASSVNMIEIWRKSEYEKVVDETLKNFGELAENVMGNQTHDDDLS